jgi:hypothetical protein
MQTLAVPHIGVLLHIAGLQHTPHIGGLLHIAGLRPAPHIGVPLRIEGLRPAQHIGGLPHMLLSLVRHTCSFAAGRRTCSSAAVLWPPWSMRG